MPAKPLLRLGTRGSPLALAQASEARERLRAAHAELAAETAIEIVPIRTTGDRIQDRPLSEIGGKGLFTKEIEEALLDGRIDAAVHSMKDMETHLPDGLAIGAILEREDPRDAFFSRGATRIADLPTGARVGTASLRRQAQVLLARPDLSVQSLRGNVATRLRKLEAGDVDATLLAIAGLKRLGKEALAQAVLAPEEMLPAVAQGAIGLETRQDDTRTNAWLAAIEHEPSARRVTAERACLAELDGSCRTPIAALAELDAGDPAVMRLRALICLPDGTQPHRVHLQGPSEEAERLGKLAGSRLRAAAGPAFFEALERTWLMS